MRQTKQIAVKITSERVEIEQRNKKKRATKKMGISKNQKRLPKMTNKVKEPIKICQRKVTDSFDRLAADRHLWLYRWLFFDNETKHYNTHDL